MNNKNLFSLRVREKLSVEELSSILDIPVATIRAWENEEKEPTAVELRKLAVFYNVSTDYLLGVGEPVARQTANVQVAQTYTQPQAEKKNRGPILHKGWYIAIPSAILVMLILMACPFWNVTSLSLFYATFEAGWATGICTLVFDALFLLYFFVILFLNRKNLAKFNVANPIVLACCFLVNLVLPIVVIVQTYGPIGFCGVLLLIVWFAMAAYCAFLAVLALVRFNKPAPEETLDVRPQQTKNLTPEQARIAEENARLIKSRQEQEDMKKQRKIASLTPAAREERVARAARIKLRPWLALIPSIVGVIFFIISATVPVYSGYLILTICEWEGTLCMFVWIGIIVAMLLAIVDLIVSVVYTKKTKRQQAALYGLCTNLIEAILFGCGAGMCFGFYGANYHSTTLFIVGLLLFVAFIYALVRFITCTRKAVILEKAKYLY